MNNFCIPRPRLIITILGCGRGCNVFKNGRGDPKHPTDYYYPQYHNSLRVFYKKA
ncbi:hypothetical protein GGR27_003753 [Lewinella antarctica]|uniref:Uncharacterized protein n=1 Tax=Neolewinella antarctica TaxID=442734 RepID=A0ABX0XHK5_9BACT|nr:hypothetical protein [Neolewinella antarctica]